MDFTRTSQRSLLASGLSGLASLVLAGASYLPFNLNTAYAQDAPAPAVQDSPESKYLPIIVEIVPESKYVISTTKRTQLIPIKDMWLTKDELIPFPKADLNTLLAEDKKPIPLIDPRKETEKDIEKKAKEIFINHCTNLTTLLKLTKTNNFLSTTGIALNPCFFLTTYSNIRSVIEEGHTIRYVAFSEGKKQETSDELKIAAYSKSNDLALLIAKKQKSIKVLPNISCASPYQGERVFSLTREFLVADIGNLEDKITKIKFNGIFPEPLNEGFSINTNGQEINVNIGALKHTICSGYVTNTLGKDGRLQISPFSDNLIPEVRLPNRTSQNNVIPTLIRRDLILVGSPIFDSKGKLLGFISINGTTGNINYTTSPYEFLKQYQAEALRRQQATAKK